MEHDEANVKKERERDKDEKCKKEQKREIKNVESPSRKGQNDIE